MKVSHPPKVLLVHNHYLERGGEDQSFEAEKALLLQHGHEICTYIRTNHEIVSYDWRRKLSLPVRTVYASDSVRDLRALIAAERPAVAHFNNTFPLISPAAYDICREKKIPVIQNIRNYRLVCPNALFFRDHHICEDCLGRAFAWPGIVHACYRDSRLQSSVVAFMLAFHRLRKTWHEKVDVYVALTDFSRRKLIDGGLPAERIVVKPNFVHDRGVSDKIGDYALFIGRIVEGKGVLTLLNAWRQCGAVPLKIVGDGPLLDSIRSQVSEQGLKTVEVCGSIPPAQVFELLKEARFLVFPALWYEAFPRVLIEAFSCGRPVIASNIGAATEIVSPGRTGLLFSAGDAADLAGKVTSLWHDVGACRAIGQEARREYESNYTPERNYRMLLEIYHRAMGSTS